MISAVYAGSFDPPTVGHLDIYQQAASLFNGNLVILIATNPKKTYMFTAEKRKEIWENILIDDGRPYKYKPIVKILPTQVFSSDYANDGGVYTPCTRS